MNRVILAVALAVAGLVGSSGPAFAACAGGLGNWTNYNTQMNGSFNSGFYECSVNAGFFGIFKARTWMTGCTLGSGCKTGSIQRSDSPCAGWTGIGIFMQANHVNYTTGVITQNMNLVVKNNSVCGSSIQISQSPPTQWILGVRCQVGWGCS